MKPDFAFELTQEQAKAIKLDEIIKKLLAAEAKGKRKMVICSMEVCSDRDNYYAKIKGMLINNEQAAKVIKVVNPENYRLNVEAGLLQEVK